ncbi:PAS domain-containing protein [Campylobacter devanensis]|uniref:PAS domain-containing protein n=1 Tax=Campylobacter devanensis TaxID=3161138 RepID=UPI000A32D911|nr:PAS domain-containing protein [Campylobacter sp. P0134]
MSTNLLNNQQKEIGDEAFITTKTDLKGYITYANSYFLNIVNAKNSDLIGKNHNIVRHPDMPRYVFKLLWDRIKNKQEVFAFVKNITFDGGYYWVFANVTSSLDESGNIIGYYSVRRKANPQAVEKIIPIYQKMLELERSSGMQASQKYIADLLATHNTTYDRFVNELQRVKG